jgi:hypothetical protein
MGHDNRPRQNDTRPAHPSPAATPATASIHSTDTRSADPPDDAEPARTSALASVRAAVTCLQELRQCDAPHVRRAGCANCETRLSRDGALLLLAALPIRELEPAMRELADDNDRPLLDAATKFRRTYPMAWTHILNANAAGLSSALHVYSFFPSQKDRVDFLNEVRARVIVLGAASPVVRGSMHDAMPTREAFRENVDDRRRAEGEFRASR